MESPEWEQKMEGEQGIYGEEELVLKTKGLVELKVFLKFQDLIRPFAD